MFWRVLVAPKARTCPVKTKGAIKLRLPDEQEQNLSKCQLTSVTRCLLLPLVYFH